MGDQIVAASVTWIERRATTADALRYWISPSAICTSEQSEQHRAGAGDPGNSRRCRQQHDADDEETDPEDGGRPNVDVHGVDDAEPEPPDVLSARVRT